MNYENALKAALDKGYSQDQAESYAKFMSHPSVRTALHTEERIAELEAKRQEKMEEEEAAAMILMDMVRILPVMDDDLSILADCAVQEPEKVIEKFEEEVAREDKVAVEEAFKLLDVNGEGHLTVETFKNIFEKLKLGTIASSDVEIFKEVADFDGDGVISLEDFRKILTYKPGEQDD